MRPRPYKIEIVEHSDTQDGNLLRTHEKLDVLMTSCVNGGPREGGVGSGCHFFFPGQMPRI